MAKLGNRKVMVTGAAGFLGANMVRKLLDEGAEVHALVKPGNDLWRLHQLASQIHLAECNLLDFDSIELYVSRVRPEIVYNFAFPGGYPSDPVEQVDMLALGLLGTYTLLDAVRRNNVERFIHIGSSTEYGTSSLPHSEDDRLEPGTLRGVSKAASSLLCQQYAREHQVNAVILRLFSVYGPWEQSKRLVPTTCRALIQGFPLKLTPPELMHDWIYVEDVIDACLMAAKHDLPCGDIINVGSGEQHSNEDVVQILCEVAQRDIAFEQGTYDPRAFDTNHWVADICHANQAMGWQPRFSLRAGLSATFQFWENILSRNQTGGGIK